MGRVKTCNLANWLLARYSSHSMETILRDCMQQDVNLRGTRQAPVRRFHAACAFDVCGAQGSMKRVIASA